MNKTSLITSVTGLALALTSVAPMIASASENEGDEVHVQASTSVSVDSEREGSKEHSGVFNVIQRVKDHASSTLRIGDKEDHKASTTQNRIEKGQEKAGDMIAKRIKSLTDLKARLANIKLLSGADLATLQASIDAEIKILNDLSAKITADGSIDTLKADVQSITKANRVYLLVEPQARIAASASRIKAVVTQLTTFGGKLQERITAAQTAGTDVSVAVTAMSDFNAKIADAKTQADAAVALTANLKVDNGDKAVLDANKTALNDARAKLVVAQKDLAAARADAAKIYSVVKGKGEVKASAETH